jgi:hypothetical protein
MPTATSELAPLPPSNIPLLLASGQITREWYIYFQSVESVLRGLRAEAARGSLALTDGMTAPTAVAGQALLYVDGTTGDLMVRFGDGVTKTITTDV